MSKTFKGILITVILGVLIYVGFWIYAIISFAGGFEKNYSKIDLINNYNKHTREIIELRNYFNMIVPKNSCVDIEFKDDNTLSIFHVKLNGIRDDNWNLKINSLKTDTLLQKLSWNRETIALLKSKIDNANCISIKNGEPCTIGFQRSGMGKYYYDIFNKVLADSLKDRYNDGCQYIYFKENVVLEYGGGVLGKQCFEGYKGDNQ